MNQYLSVFRLLSNKCIAAVLSFILLPSYNLQLFTACHFFDSGISTFTNSFETEDYRYSWVQSNHIEITVPVNTILQTTTCFGFHLKPGLTSNDIPDSTVIRLRNLVGINAQGEYLPLGSHPLTVYNSITAILESGIDAITVYPNPSHDVIYLDIPFDVDVNIFNIQGQFIKRVSTNHSVDVSDLSSGIYYLKIQALGMCYKMTVQ